MRDSEVTELVITEPVEDKVEVEREIQTYEVEISLFFAVKTEKNKEPGGQLSEEEMEVDKEPPNGKGVVMEEVVRDTLVVETASVV